MQKYQVKDWRLAISKGQCTPRNCPTANWLEKIIFRT